MRLIWRDVPWCAVMWWIATSCSVPPAISRHLLTCRGHDPAEALLRSAPTQERLTACTKPTRQHVTRQRHDMSCIDIRIQHNNRSSRIFQYYFWRFRWLQLFVLNCPSMTRVLQEWGWGSMASNMASSVVSCNVMSWTWRGDVPPRVASLRAAGMLEPAWQGMRWKNVELLLNCPCPCEPKLAHWRPQPLA